MESLDLGARIFNYPAFRDAICDGETVMLSGIHSYNSRDHFGGVRFASNINSGFERSGGGYLCAGTYFSLLDRSGVDGQTEYYDHRCGRVLCDVEISNPLFFSLDDIEKGDWGYASTVTRFFERMFNLPRHTYRTKISEIMVEAGYDSVIMVNAGKRAGEEHGSQINVLDTKCIKRIKRINKNDFASIRNWVWSHTEGGFYKAISDRTW